VVRLLLLLPLLLLLTLLPHRLLLLLLPHRLLLLLQSKKPNKLDKKADASRLFYFLRHIGSLLQIKYQHLGTNAVA
jgi:hypothetical protein